MSWDYELNPELVDMLRDALPRPDGIRVAAVYWSSAGYLAQRAQGQQRRDLDFTLEELHEYLGGGRPVPPAECQVLVRLELWAELGDGRFRLLGLNRWVRIRGLKVGSAATGHRVTRAPK